MELGRVEEENVWRNNWNSGPFERRYKNLVQWKLPKTYEGDLEEVF